MIEFRLTGQWSVSGDLLKGLPRDLQAAGRIGQRKAAELIVKIAKKHLRDQDLGWAPLSENTQSKGNKILIRTRDYYSAIQFWQRGNTYYAGVKRASRNRKGVPIYMIAIIHEFGTSTIPSRPLWRPTRREIGGKKGMRDIVKKEIAKKLGKFKRNGFSAQW